MKFKRLEISDKNIINKYFEKNTRIGCEYSFACNFLWQELYGYTYSIIEDCYVARYNRDGVNIYNLPIGEKADIIKAVDKIISSDNTAVIRGIDKENICFLEENFKGVFEFYFNRDESDYIYLSEDLINLSGRKYQSKRNLIKRFKDNPNWSYEAIDNTNKEECIALNRFWAEEKNTETEDIRRELAAANTALAYLEKLDLIGGLLRVDGKVSAYSIGERLTEDTFVIHFEKALDIKGCYQTVNNEFAKRNCKDYKYINREEDTGDEGLRKAKLSYRPTIILDKYEARRKV